MTALDLQRCVVLRQDEHMATVALLDELLHGHRDAGGIGYDRGDAPAVRVVDWDALGRSYLSTTEKAIVQLAEGIFRLERHGGGVPPRLRDTVRMSIEAVL